jgi:hypothetical protein
MNSVKLCVAAQLQGIFELGAGRARRSGLAEHGLAFGEEVGLAEAEDAEAADARVALDSDDLADVTLRVEQVGPGEFPAVDVQRHAGIAVLSVVGAAMAIAAAALAAEFTPAVVLACNSQGGLPVETIELAFKAVLNSRVTGRGLYLAALQLLLPQQVLD